MPSKHNRAHVVAAATFGPRLAPVTWVLCTCGTELRGPTAEDVADRFQAHRRSMGLGYSRLSSFMYATEDSPPKLGIAKDREYREAVA